MGDWKISVLNQTGAGGLKPKDVNFMMFQIPPQQLEIDSWTNAWKVAKVGYPASVGPIILPVKVQFYIRDKTHGNPRNTGPFDVKFGQTYSVDQKDGDEAPTITLTSEVAPEGQIKVINAKGNAKPLEMALFKDEKPLLSFKDVVPAKAAYLAVQPALYIADVEGSVKEGEDFKAVVQAAEATRFQLYPVKTQIIILIEQLESGEIQFLEASSQMMKAEHSACCSIL